MALVGGFQISTDSNAEMAITFDMLVENYKNCTYDMEKCTKTNTIQALGINAETRREIADMASRVRPIIHRHTLTMFKRYLAFVKAHGNSVEKEVYKLLNCTTLIDRLLTCRPLSFMQARDFYILKREHLLDLQTGPQWRDRADVIEIDGLKGFETIGLENEKPPLVLKELQSYDEMMLSALMSVSVPTFFINDGDRCNEGVPADGQRPYEKFGVYTGAVGTRFERPGQMEYRCLLITRDQNTKEHGYGPLPQNTKGLWNLSQADSSKAGHWTKHPLFSPPDLSKMTEEQKSAYAARIGKRGRLTILAQLYNELDTKTRQFCFPTWKQASRIMQADKGKADPRFKPVTNNTFPRNSIFNVWAYRRRIRLSLDPFLLDADRRAADVHKDMQRRGVYCHVVGLGLGAWCVEQKIQTEEFVRAAARAISELPLGNIADVDLSWFPQAIVKDIFEVEALERRISVRNNCSWTLRKQHRDIVIDVNGILGNAVRVHCSKRNPSAKLVGQDAGKLLVAMYAWDSNSFPGNEYWIGSLSLSGDPAAACCSLIPQLQDPHVNPALRGRNALVLPRGQEAVCQVPEELLAMDRDKRLQHIPKLWKHMQAKDSRRYFDELVTGLFSAPLILDNSHLNFVKSLWCAQETFQKNLHNRTMLVAYETDVHQNGNLLQQRILDSIIFRKFYQRRGEDKSKQLYALGLWDEDCKLLPVPPYVICGPVLINPAFQDMPVKNISIAHVWCLDFSTERTIDSQTLKKFNFSNDDFQNWCRKRYNVVLALAYRGAITLGARYLYIPAIGLGERCKALSPLRKQLLKVAFEEQVSSTAQNFPTITTRKRYPYKKGVCDLFSPLQENNVCIINPCDPGVFIGASNSNTIDAKMSGGGNPSLGNTSMFLHNPFFSTDLTDPSNWKYITAPLGSLGHTTNRLVLEDILNEDGQQKQRLGSLSNTQMATMLTQMPFVKTTTKRRVPLTMADMQKAFLNPRHLKPKPKPKHHYSKSAPSLPPRKPPSLPKAASPRAEEPPRKQSIADFWFFAKTTKTSGIVIQGGTIEVMNKAFKQCSKRRVKWKALLNVRSFNVREPEVICMEPSSIHPRIIAMAVLGELDYHILGKPRPGGNQPSSNSLESLPDGFRHMFVQGSRAAASAKVDKPRKKYKTRTFDFEQGPFGMVLSQNPGLRLNFTDGISVRTIVKEIRSGSWAEKKGIKPGMWLYKINTWSVGMHKLKDVHAQLKELCQTWPVRLSFVTE